MYVVLVVIIKKVVNFHHKSKFYACMYVCMTLKFMYVLSVIMGNSSNPIRGLVFDSVVVENPGSKPWGDDYYFCQNDGGVQVP